MMASILIDHPNRIGDSLILNGLVREYCKRYARVGVFSLPRYAASISYVFRDLPNLKIHTLPTHRDKRIFCRLNWLRMGERRYDAILRIETDPESGVLFERQYYAQAKIPFEKKWDSFYVERDPAREDALFQKIILSQPYIFVHDDGRYPIKPDRLPERFSVVRPTLGITNNFFDYCSVLEGAAEIHAIDSSFMFLTDLLPYQNPEQKLFVHRYSRQPNVLWNMPVLKKPWTILEK